MPNAQEGIDALIGKMNDAIDALRIKFSEPATGPAEKNTIRNAISILDGDRLSLILISLKDFNTETASIRSDLTEIKNKIESFKETIRTFTAIVDVLSELIGLISELIPLLA